MRDCLLKRARFIGLLVVAFASTIDAAGPVRSDEPGHTQTFARPEPIAFAVNRGQADPDVRFLAGSPGRTIALTAHGAIFGLKGSTAARTTRLHFLDAADASISAAGEISDPLYFSAAHGNGP